MGFSANDNLGPRLSDIQKQKIKELEKEYELMPDAWICFDGINSRLTPKYQEEFLRRLSDIIDTEAQ